MPQQLVENLLALPMKKPVLTRFPNQTDWGMPEKLQDTGTITVEQDFSASEWWLRQKKSKCAWRYWQYCENAIQQWNGKGTLTIIPGKTTRVKLRFHHFDTGSGCIPDHFTQVSCSGDQWANGIGLRSSITKSIWVRQTTRSRDARSFERGRREANRHAVCPCRGQRSLLLSRRYPKGKGAEIITKGYGAIIVDLLNFGAPMVENHSFGRKYISFLAF